MILKLLMVKYFSIIVLTLWVLMTVFAGLLNLDSVTINLRQILQPPSFELILGADELGRGVFSRLIEGARISFMVAFTVVGISAFFGTLVGTIACYFGGKWEQFLVAVIDLFLAFPGILLAIAIAAILGPSIGHLILALCIVGWVGYARLARAQVLSLKNREHISAAKALGTSHWRIIGQHLLPLLLAPLIVEATFGIAGMVIAEAGLSFLGLGVQPPISSWGSMIKEGANFMLVAPHLVLAPGIALMLVVFSVNLLGDQLRDYLNVKSI